jgi:hypothetical protein
VNKPHSLLCAWLVPFGTCKSSCFAFHALSCVDPAPFLQLCVIVCMRPAEKRSVSPDVGLAAGLSHPFPADLASLPILAPSESQASEECENHSYRIEQQKKNDTDSNGASKQNADDSSAARC